MPTFKQHAAVGAVVLLSLVAASAQATVIVPVPTTSIGPCVECLPGRVWLITEITDGIKDEAVANPGAPYNGFAGATGEVGTIHLDLIGTYNLTRFSLWNDINVAQEGVDTFRLDFFDEANLLISSSPILNAPVSQLTAGVYDFAPVLGVGRVDLVVLSNLASPSGQRIEIREVEFEGEPVPEPTTLALLGAGLVAVRARRRRRA
jgi:hypothetical protein